MAEAALVDLRSDTVTRPTPGMRRAMAEATAAPYSWRQTCRQASSPAADPAEVTTGPVST